MIAWLVMKYLHLYFKPKKIGEIDNKGIRHILKIKDIFLGDEEYYLAAKEDIEKFLKINLFKFRKYVPSKYDCDNYAFSLMGLFTNLMSGYAIGIVWVKEGKATHALNFFIDGTREFWYIEPQTNKIFKKETYKPYFVVM